jgi:hypothetical protein
MPHTTQSFVDLDHDLRGLTIPAQLEELLPHMTSVSMNHSFWDSTKKFTDHLSLVVLWNRIECLLNNVTTESIHAERENIAVNGVGDRNDLIRCAVLEAALDQEVAEAVDHQRVSLIDDGLDDFVLLLCSANLELLLKKDRSLLIIAANDLIDDVFPITRNRLVQETTIVHGLERSDVSRTSGIVRLDDI